MGGSGETEGPDHQNRGAGSGGERKYILPRREKEGGRLEKKDGGSQRCATKARGPLTRGKELEQWWK